MGELRQREPRYENRALLDLAHRINECTNCGAYMAHGCNPCHEAGIEAGKGQSTKSHDQRHFAGCNDCHAWYDSVRKGLDPSGIYTEAPYHRREMFDRAHKRTFDVYWRHGWLKVV